LIIRIPKQIHPAELNLGAIHCIYRYSIKDHHLVRILGQDHRDSLSKAALGQDCIREAPAVFVITAVYEKTSRKYGNRAERYVKMEAGHAGQNLLLQHSCNQGPFGTEYPTAKVERSRRIDRQPQFHVQLK
jgi:hypothetical protein